MSAASSWSLVAVAVLTGLAGCSATRFERDACTAHSQCRASFGFGAVCQPDGFCAPATLPRCDRAFPEDLLADGARYRDAVVLGSLTDRSSPAQVVRERAIRLAFQEASAAGGLDGRPVAVLQCDIQENARLDGATRSEAAAATAARLAGELGVPALIGPASSGDAQAVWERVGRIGTLVLSPSATSDTLGGLEPATTEDQPGLLWSVAPPDHLQGRVIAEDLLERGVRRVYLLRETGPYGEGLANLIAERFGAGGGSLHIESLPAQERIAAALAAVPADEEAEVVFISSQQRWIIEFLRQAGGQPGFAERRLFLTDAAANQAVLDGAAEAAALFPRVRGTRPAPPDPSDYVHASFVAGYRAEYGGEDPGATTYSAHAYDAAWLLLYGAAWATLQSAPATAPLTGLTLARGLRRLQDGAPTPVVPSAWKGALAALRAGRGLDLRGASGPLDYDPDARAPAGAIEIWGVADRDGRFSMTPLHVRADLPKETP